MLGEKMLLNMLTSKASEQCTTHTGSRGLGTSGLEACFLAGITICLTHERWFKAWEHRFAQESCNSADAGLDKTVLRTVAMGGWGGGSATPARMRMTPQGVL